MSHTFNPNIPVNGTNADANPVRENFNALNDRDGALAAQIAAIPAGPPGADGRDGSDGRGIAEVYDSGDGRAMVRMTDGAIYGPFTIASGPAGRDGTSLVMSGDWNNGTGYTAGAVVAYNGQLYAAMDYAMGTPPDMDGRWRLLTLTGPPGGPGGPGEKGDKGDTGERGEQGMPGEVTVAQLAEALAGTSANTNGVQLLALNVSDPPTQSEMQAIANKMDELIQALRR